MNLPSYDRCVLEILVRYLLIFASRYLSGEVKSSSSVFRFIKRSELFTSPNIYARRRVIPNLLTFYVFLPRYVVAFSRPTGFYACNARIIRVRFTPLNDIMRERLM